ncbi:MAG TPA: hypothetical protein VFD53_05270, partial [Ilumatobacter sp.]|nr:hypothetical protein [Ilumatobacter sp.]
PEDVVITGTRLVFDNGGTANQKQGITINTASRAVRGVTLTGNEVDGGVGGSSLQTAFILQTSGSYSYSGITIVGNRGAGVKFGVDLATEPNPTCAPGNCSACCDTADPDCTKSIVQSCPSQLCRSDNASSCAYDEVPVVTDNVFAVTAGGAAIRPNYRTVIGGNSTRPWLAGERTPGAGASGPCMTGSLYTRTGTGTGSKLCVCEAGAWREKSVTGGPCL